MPMEVEPPLGHHLARFLRSRFECQVECLFVRPTQDTLVTNLGNADTQAISTVMGCAYQASKSCTKPCPGEGSGKGHFMPSTYKFYELMTNPFVHPLIHSSTCGACDPEFPHTGDSVLFLTKAAKTNKRDVWTSSLGRLLQDHIIPPHFQDQSERLAEHAKLLLLRSPY